MLKAAKAYLSTQVTTATQGDLLLLLYDTAIKHLKLAKEKMALRDYGAKGILISKAIEIISELHECLNKERGGEVAKNLSQVYFLCNTRLLQANLEMNPEKIEEVIGILGGLRQAFAQIIPSQEGMAPASQSAILRPERPAGEPQADECAPAQPDAALPAEPEPSAADAPGAEAPAQATAPVSTARSRAASAYANSR